MINPVFCSECGTKLVDRYERIPGFNPSNGHPNQARFISCPRNFGVLAFVLNSFGKSHDDFILVEGKLEATHRFDGGMDY